MLGCDAHIINNLSFCNLICQFLCSIVYHYIKERVHLWNHETQSIFNHKKHLSNTLLELYIFCHLKMRKYKNTFTSCKHHTNHKNIIQYHLYHPCTFIYTIAYLFLFCICYFYIFYLHLVLDNHLVRLRAQNNLLCFAGLIKKDKEIILLAQFSESSI